MDRLTSGTGPELRSDRLRARLAPNRGTNGGFSLIIDGTTQSHVNPADPTDLQLTYVRMVAGFLDDLFPAGRPISVLHLGGGALTMPRYIAATRPGSRQHVVELFRELYEFVVEHLPLDDGTITAEFADARDAAQRLDERYDLIIVDVFSGDIAPRHVSTVEFFTQAHDLLAPGGVLLVNTLTTRGLDFAREALATLREVFAERVAAGTEPVFAGATVGNIVIAASDRSLDAAVLEHLPGTPLSVQTRRGAALDAFVGDAPSRHD